VKLRVGGTPAGRDASREQVNASNISTPVAPQEGASHLARQESGSAR